MRRADVSVGSTQLIVRILVALAVALLSLPMLATSSAYADGEVPPESATSEAPADPGTDPPPAEPDPEPEAPAPEEPAAEEPNVEVPAEQPAAEEPAADAPAEAPAEEPAAEQPAGKPIKAGAAIKSAGEAVSPDAAPTADANCAASFDQNTQENSGGSWINGALNQNNSNYAEGDYVPQRVELTGLTPGTHTLTFSFDRTKNGKYAYDFVDFLAISGSAGASVSWDAEAPNPPMPFAETVFVEIEFTIVANDPTATLTWAGHIASELDYGPNTGAGSINGAPYHFSLVSMSCGNVGQQDNQLMADAVDFGKLTIVKDAQPNDAQDFTFTIDAPNDLHTQFNLDDDADGTLPNTVTYNVPPGVSTAKEINIPGGWTLTNLSCVNASGNTSQTSLGTATATITVVDDGTTTCTFINSRESNLEVDKYWVINGGAPIEEGSEPAHLGLGAQLTINGGNQPWNTSIGGFLQGAGVTLNESVTFGNPLCDWAGATHGAVTEDNGQAPADGSLPYSDTLGGGANHYTITNTVTCNGELTLVKDVLNGPALPSAWTLSATGGPGTLAFASGSTGVTHPVTSGSPYLLDENDADSRYNQVGDWTCTQFGTVGQAGDDQTVAVAAGRSTTCTVVNATAVLVLRKVVQNPNGGTAVPGDFTLVASPQSGGADLSTPGSGAGTSYFVDPDEVFDLSETGGPFGYTLTGIDCGSGPVTSVQVPISTTVTCTFTNVDSPGALTLNKIVDDNGTGDNTPKTAWHLSATPLNIANQATIEGDGHATGATKAGTYQLAESGPATHTAGDWICEDDAGAPVPVSAIDQITLAASQIVFCEITNTAITPQLTLIKHVDPGDTGDETGPDAFTLFAIPDGIVGQGTVSGPGPQVDADVMVGTYTLDEDGPSTYEMDAAGWTCTDAQDNPVPVSASDQFSIGLGEHITCEVTNNAIPSTWDVVKTSDPVSGSTVEEGDVITYTITVTRHGDGVNVEDVPVFDDLSDVLDDATGPDNLAASQGTPVFDDATDTISWVIPELSDTATLTYTVTVGPNDGATLRNHVTSPGSDNCPPEPETEDPDCTTVQYTPEWELDKTASLADTDGDGFADPGEVITYTLTATNTSENADATIVVVDEIADVLEHTTLGTLGDGLTALDADTLEWVLAGVLAPGASASVSYTVTVNSAEDDPDVWDQELINVATPDSPGGVCIPAEPDADGDAVDGDECSTDTDTPPVTDVPVQKVDQETLEVLAGATFQLWSHPDGCTEPGVVGTFEDLTGPNDELLATVVTNEIGMALFENMQHGCYLLVETSPPPNYELPANNAMEVLLEEPNFNPDGAVDTIVVTDFAEGLLAIIPKRQYELNDDLEWVLSDGIVEFGDLVKYQVDAVATGPKNFHNVVVTDFVPGYNPVDELTTKPGVLVPGSATCVPPETCTVSVNEETQLVTFDIGDIEPGPGETITVTAEMIVEFPLNDVEPEPGETVTGAMWNIGYLDYDQVVGGTPPEEEPVERSSAGAGAGRVANAASALDFVFEHTTLESLPVLVEASKTAGEPVIDNCITNPDPEKCEPPLPDTGAPAHLGQLAALGGLVLGLGLLMVTRRRRELEQA